jgi:hypothetical protein
MLSPLFPGRPRFVGRSLALAAGAGPVGPKPHRRFPFVQPTPPDRPGPTSDQPTQGDAHVLPIQPSAKR